MKKLVSLFDNIVNLNNAWFNNISVLFIMYINYHIRIFKFKLRLVSNLCF